jgi:nucleosome binding factor SPN SPT16 subunit
MEVAINDEQFYSRLNKFITHWNQNKETLWENTNILCIPMGAVKDADVVYSKSSAMHLYLLGYEFPESLMILTPNKFYFITTQKKAAYLEAIKDDTKFPIETFYKTKDENANKEMFKTLLTTLKKTGTTVMGTILKGEFEGKFIPLWNETLAGQGFTTVDVSRGLGVLLSTKDATELVPLAPSLHDDAPLLIIVAIGCLQKSFGAYQ